MTGHGSKPRWDVLITLILFAITVGIITLNILKGEEDKVKVDITIEEVQIEDFVGSDENIPSAGLIELEEYWRPVMPDRDLPKPGTTPKYRSCSIGGNHERI